MPFPEIQVVDRDDDGVAEIVVRGGTIGSAGAGVVRSRTEVWRWDGAAVTLAGTTLDPTQYRHHILYEANDLMAAGDLDGALALYEAAINDPALRNDGFAHAPEQVYADVSRFAAFRLVLIDLLQGCLLYTSRHLRVPGPDYRRRDRRDRRRLARTGGRRPLLRRAHLHRQLSRHRPDR